MRTTVTQALGFMSTKEKALYFLFLTLRALVGLLDLLAILGIGILASSLANSLSRTGQNGAVGHIGSITVPQLEVSSLPFLGFMILLTFVLKAALSILFTHKSAQLLAKVEARAARTIANNAHSSGLENARTFSRNEILFAVQVGSPGLFNALLNSVSTLAAESFLFLIVLVTFASLSPVVALSALVYFGLIGFTIQLFIGKQLERTSSAITESSIRSSEGLLDLGEVFREVFTANKKSFFIDKIYKSRLKAASNVATQYVLQGAPRHIVETALILGISVFIFLQALAGDLVTAAAVTAVFLTGGLRLTAALIPLQSAILSIKQSVPLTRQALKILTMKTNSNQLHVSNEASISETSPIGVIFERVSFSYENSQRQAIQEVSLIIEPGKQVAFIGPSGAGKSTLADLMLGLLIPTSGEIRLQGVEPNFLVYSQPGLLGYVPQNPGMVTGTLADNIALGVEPSKIDQERLDQAVAEAHLSDLVASLPNGLMTSIGNAKDDFSGGQLQRIGLARALYNRPRLLVMDEATSALDAESEAKINFALDGMRGQTTVVLIAHRLNTVQKSDEVFLLEEGQVSASGTFTELLATNETVKKLVSLMSLD